MKKYLYLSVATVVIFSGCAGTAGQAIAPKIDESKQELKTPTARNTKFDKPLANLGKLFEIFDENEIIIQAKTISNKSGQQSLPTDITTMVVTAVNKISNRIVYVPYDPNYISSEQQTGSIINRKKPTVVISGAITEYDKDTDKIRGGEKGGFMFGKGLGLFDGGSSQNSQESSSSIAIDLHLLNYADTTYINGVQSSNTIKIYKQSKDRDFDFHIAGNGVGFRGSVDKTQGEHAAIRLLVEMSVFEIIGKYTRLPYWLCFEEMKPDIYVIEELKKQFEQLDDNLKIVLVQGVLILHGYNIAENGIIDEATKNAITDYCDKNNLAKSIDYALFAHIRNNINIDKAYQIVQEQKRLKILQQKELQKQQEQLAQQTAQLQEEQKKQAELLKQKEEQELKLKEQLKEIKKHKKPTFKNQKKENEFKMEKPKTILVVPL